jgi:hypothetical protein
LWYKTFRCVVRLNKAANGHGVDGIGIDGETMADSRRAALVVPLRDRAEMQLIYAMSGTAQSKTYQSRKA